MKNEPEKIYLQIGDDTEEIDTFNELDGITWCSERINENDIEYQKNLYDLNKCTRVEVIDENGRSYVSWNKKNIIEISMQDDNRTLKIFITKNRVDEKTRENI